MSCVFNRVYLLVLAISFLFSACGAMPTEVSSSRLKADNEAEVAKGQLSDILANIAKMETYVERSQFARLFVLRKVTQKTLTSVQTIGLGNMATMRSYQEMIVAFRFSVTYFHELKNEKNEKVIDSILAISKKIEQDRGFDDSPYTQITASVFTQMHVLILELISRDGVVDDALKAKLVALKAPIGYVIAVAKEGDRPNTFKAAVPVYHQIAALYMDFDKIMGTHAAFNSIIEIQGLNEFYAEYAQIR